MDKIKFKIYSLLVVKDEADVIAASLLDACRWSDKIIVIDNGSTDGTWDIICELSKKHLQIIPWLRYEGPFHIGLRAKAFRTFRHEMSCRDWWCVRLDADEFYEGDVRAFLAEVPSMYRTVKKESTDYILTKEDLAQLHLTNDFVHDRPLITHSLPSKRQERRFMRHDAFLTWLDNWRYPHPWGLVWRKCIPVQHYQYRNATQMAKRYITRQQAKADGCGSFSHETGKDWKDYIMTNHELHMRTLSQNIREIFQQSTQILQQGRNCIKVIENNIVVKQFKTPRFPNNWIYGRFRKTKAQRSWEFAQLLGELTPPPLFYREYRKGGILYDSYYACQLSPLPYTLRQVVRNSNWPNRSLIMQGVGRFMAQLHQKGLYALDFSGGNILVNDDGSQVQIVDLNRMRIFQHIDLSQGCKQTTRLHLTKNDCQELARAYADTQQWDYQQCLQLIQKNHIPIDK